LNQANQGIVDTGVFIHFLLLAKPLVEKGWPRHAGHNNPAE
jgi:hypothetical protein